MIYSVRVPIKYYFKLEELCEEYNSFRECVLKEIEKKYGVKIYNSKKSHDMKRMRDNIPKPVFIIIYDEENKRLEELARKLGKSKYQIIMETIKK
ncbi:hypothetical protein AFV9_gp24 [Betalipothrixvirus uzonense]|uniref:Uncharacterized protein n=1 Tax=Betalipothrixvirus uzonense TaxID=512792 RepID=B2CRK1_9VIRU|nr:hypothetical protein AFV9_gp24 [Acidianus filamentous virus 9]ACB37258.1 hypothetical protein [Acidianus filamentous virus 9]